MKSNNQKCKTSNKDQREPAHDSPNSASDQTCPTGKRRFRVHVNVNCDLAAEVVINSGDPGEAEHKAEAILQGRAFRERLHKILERHTVTVPVDGSPSVEVLVESILLDWPPTAMAWQMVDLDLDESIEP